MPLYIVKLSFLLHILCMLSFLCYGNVLCQLQLAVYCTL